MSEGLSILDNLDLDNIPDLAPVPRGEYELKIVSCEVEESKNTPGNFNVVLVMEVLNEPTAFNVFRYLSLPNASDSDKTRDSKARFLKEALTAFGMDKSDIGTEFAKGKTAWALLDCKTYEGRESNEVKRFIIPA